MRITNAVLVALVCAMCAVGDMLALFGHPPVGCGLAGIAMLYPLALPLHHRTIRARDTQRLVTVATFVIVSTAALGLVRIQSQTIGLCATAIAILSPKWALVGQSFRLYVLPALDEARIKSRPRQGGYKG